MYIFLVLLQTLVLPLASGTIQLAVAHGDPISTYGVWFLFWGVGTRLAVAGVSQIIRPSFTVQNILGAENAGAAQITQELGFANLAIGIGAIVATFVGGWGIPLALAGGLFLGLAGIRHLPKRHPNAKESVATWTDLLMLVVMAIYVVHAILIGP
jgi:hypothetical protein